MKQKLYAGGGRNKEDGKGDDKDAALGTWGTRVFDNRADTPCKRGATDCENCDRGGRAEPPNSAVISEDNEEGFGD